MAGDSIQELKQGDPAPSFELPGTDDALHTLDDYADTEAALIVFTCNHCPYAIAKIPALNEFAAEYDEVAVIGINPNDPSQYPDDSFEKMKEYVADGTVQYDAYLFDETQEVAKAYYAVCTPDPYLFARDNGRFTLAYHGRIDDAMNPDDEPATHDMRDAIEAVLAGEPVEQSFRPSRGCTIKWRDGNVPDYWDKL